MSTNPPGFPENVSKPPTPAHPAEMSDAPTDFDGDDLLDRLGFAQSVAQMLLDMGGSGSIRAGVYGRWGEGKTSVLGMVAREVRRRGGVTVWFSPWPADSAKALRFRLISQIADSLGLKHTGLKFWRGASASVSTARHVGSAYSSAVERVDAHVGAFAQSFIDKVSYDKADKFLEKIREETKDRPIVVLVDDLDRVEPERLPDLLLLLRDGLDFPGMRFVLALDPDVVHKGLKAVHPAWGERGSFLEKIVEYPRYLPPLTSEQLDHFVTEETKRVGYKLSPLGLATITPLLPRHPRKTKLLLRLLTTFSTFLDRFNDFELQRAPFYLAQLMIAEFPTEVAALVTDPVLRKALDHASILQYSSTLRKDGDPLEALKPLVPDGPQRERFIELAQALIRESNLMNDASPSFYLTVADSPPIVTWRETEKFLSAAIGMPEAKRREAVQAFIADADGVPSRRRSSALWAKLVEAEVLAFEQAIDQHTWNEEQVALQEVEQILDVLDDMLQSHAFARNLLDSSDWLALYRALGKYSNWIHPNYERIRNREVAVLRTATASLTHDQRRALVAPLRQNYLSVGHQEDEATPVFQIAMELFRAITAEYASELVTNFTVAEGVLAPAFTSTLDQWMWFDVESPVYASEGNVHLQDVLTTEAPTAASIGNSYALFGALVHAVSGNGSIRSASAIEVLRTDELAAKLWKVATSERLNRRMMGSLRDYANTLTEKFDFPADWFPIPDWAEPNRRPRGL